MILLFCSGNEQSEEDAECVKALKEKVQGLEERLASSQSELEEVKEHMRLGVLSVECADGDTLTAGAGTEGQAGVEEEGLSQEAQQLRARVAELEEELAKRQGNEGGQSSPDSDTVKQLTEKVEALQAALDQKESGEGEGEECLRGKVAELQAALAESTKPSEREGRVVGDEVRCLQERLGELEGELKKCVPRTELEEVQVTLGLQCEQLARERADVARRLNDALLELERLRPPARGNDEEEEEEEEHSESSERSLTSGVPRCLFSLLTSHLC